MTTSEEFQFTAMEAERLREQVRQLEAENTRLRKALVNSDVKIVYLLSDIAVSKARWKMQHRANLTALGGTQ